MLSRYRVLQQQRGGRGGFSVVSSPANSLGLPLERIDASFAKPRSDSFAYDGILGGSVSQKDVFETTTRPLLPSVLMGVNSTVFVYGQTGR
jgi:hypothetical protein